MRYLLPLLSLAVFAAIPVHAAPSAWTPKADFQADVHLSLFRFEQQVKLEVGDDPGKPLVQDSLFSVYTTATWRPWDHIQLGWFARYDTGHQLAALFDGEDAEGRTQTRGEISGDFSEFWTGPLFRADWRGLFVEFGYGLVGIRDDATRVDLPDDKGSTSSAFRTSSTVAMLAGFGGQLNVWSSLDVVFRLQYRVRYYDTRGDRPLVGDRAHGTQDYTPFIGAAWRFDATD